MYPYIYPRAPYTYPTQPTMQMQPQPSMYTPQANIISCEMVGDFETVKAAQIDISGQPKYYPLSDGSTIYRKQLMSDGTSKIFRYNLVTDEVVQETKDLRLVDALKSLDTKLDNLYTQVNQINQLWGGNINE